MFNKKLLFGVLAFSLLPMFSASALAPMDSKSDTDLIYLKLGYQGIFVANNKIDGAKSVEVTATGLPLPGALSFAPSAKDTSGTYEPNYAPNFVGGSLAIGTSFAGETRAELEIAASTQIEIDNDDKMEYFNNTATTNSAFINKGFKFAVAALNLYYDLGMGESGITPYIGGGVGVAKVNFMSSPTAETITYPLALQFKAGLQMKLNDTVPFYLGYKLVHLLTKESDSINSFIPRDEAPRAGVASVPESGAVGSAGYIPPVIGVTAFPGTKVVDTKLKSSYTLHSFDVGLMLII